MNEENLQMAFAQIDEDGNGNLTKDELKNAFSSHRLEDEQIWNQFIKEADKDDLIINAFIDKNQTL